MGARRGRGADVIHSQPPLNFVAGFLGRSALARWSRVLRRAQVPRSPCRCSRPARPQPLLCSSSLQRVPVSSAARRLPEPESLSYAEYLRLCQEARRHDVLYYRDQPAPEIADEEYDWLVAFILEAERLHPEWQVSSESPSLRVGGAQPGARFPQAPHLRPLLSLNNTYQWSEVESQAVRISRLAAAEHDGEEYSGSVAPFCVEPKIDGVALSLVYEDRQVVRAVTRGDGSIGDVVTDNVLEGNITGIPRQLSRRADIPQLLEVRGEVFMPLEVFSRLNRERSTAGLPLLSNPRNAAAGALKLLDAKAVGERQLAFVAYDAWPFVLAKSQFELLSVLGELGFAVPALARRCSSLAELRRAVDEFVSRRAQLPYQADGVVLKMDAIVAREALGATAKAPRGAFAYKLPAANAVTTVSAIRIQVSRSGVLTPVADLTPVQIGGVTITHATLHNFGEVQRLGVRPGDVVALERSGDVIPKITKVVSSASGDARDAVLDPPVACPACGARTVRRDEDGIAVYCPNFATCPPQVLGRMVHFASKNAMDINGLGVRTCAQLLDAGLARCPSDVYDLRTGDIVGKVDGFAARRAENLLHSIEASRRQPLDRVVRALGIPGVGQTHAATLARIAGSMSGLLDLSESLRQNPRRYPELGEKSAALIAAFLGRDEVHQEIRALMAKGVQPRYRTEPKDATRQHPLSGQLIAFTGTLSSMSRGEAEQAARTCGAIVRSAITKKLSFVVVGDAAGAKKAKAAELGVRTVSEEEFLALLGLS